MNFSLWVLVYSPITNENIVKLVYFTKSTDLESFVLNNRESIITRTFEEVVFDTVLCIRKEALDES